MASSISASSCAAVSCDAACFFPLLFDCPVRDIPVGLLAHDRRWRAWRRVARLCGRSPHRDSPWPSTASHPGVDGPPFVTAPSANRKTRKKPGSLATYGLFSEAGWTGLEPAASGVTGDRGLFAESCSASQVPATPSDTGSAAVQDSQPVAPLHKPFAATLLLGSPSREPLLTVRDAAARLGVCTRTVYELCEHGKLPHVRIGNAIRIAPAELDAFVAASRPA